MPFRASSLVPATALLLAVLPPTSQAYAAETLPCGAKTARPAVTIAECTAHIDGGTATPASLRLAFAVRAKAYKAAGSLDRALADIDAAIAGGPDDARLLNTRGMIQFDRKRFDLALADYDKAIAADPRSPGSYINRANALAMMRNSRRALDDYDMAIALDPKRFLAYYNRGILHEKLGNKDRAIADMRATRSIAPQFQPAQEALKRLVP